jgi:hypothetical protein
VSDEITAKFYGNRVKITHDGPDGFGSVFVTDDEAEKLRIALYAVTKQAREREAERRAEAAKPKTVRVRIAVAVDEKGNAYAVGWKDSAPDEEAMAEQAIDNLLTCEFDAQQTALVWVTADVPFPVTPVVEGSVSRAE